MGIFTLFRNARASWFFALILISSAAVACSNTGPSEEDIQRIVDQRVATVIASVPTVTPSFTATPHLTATPQPTATKTRIRFPATPTPQPVPKTFSDIFTESAFSVFRIETGDGVGTGWLIEPGLILTNQHVVDDAFRVNVRQNEGGLFFANVVAVDAVRDIALLSFNASNTIVDSRSKPLTISEAYTSDIASSMLAMGYSGGLTASEDETIGPATANIGVLSSFVHFIDADVGNLVIDAAVDPGDSGGPVLNANGQVVGMIRAAQVFTSSGQRVVGTFYAVDTREIIEALPDLKLGRSR